MKSTKTIILMLWLIVASFATHAETTITIKPNTTYQTIEGIGGGIVYYLDWITTHKNKEILYDTLFNGLGLSALRMGNWAHEENADLTYDAEIYKAAKDRLGKNFILEMSSWSAPANLKANGALSGTCGGPIKATLKKEYNNFVYDQYGQWWKRAVEQYQKVGVYPDYISLQNEPDCDADYESTLFDEKANNTIAHYGTALTSVSKYIKQLGTAPKIIGPEALGIGWEKVQNYVKNLNSSLLDGICFHYYHSGLNDHDGMNMRYSYPDDFLWAMTTLSTDYYGKKPMFMTENSSLRDYQELDPINTAIFMSYAFSVNHVASYMYWNLIWGDEGDAAINLDFDERGYKSEDGYTINGDYHAIRHFSKFVPRGWKNIDAQTTDGDVIVSAFKSPAGDEYTVVIINRKKNYEYIRLPFFPEGTVAYITRSTPLDKVWSQYLGERTSLDGIYPPGNSITTITYRKPPTRHVFLCKDKESDYWGNQSNWSPSRIPEASDTTVIRIGEVVAAGVKQTAPIFIEKNGTFALSANCAMSEMRLQGGTIKSNTSNPLFELDATIYADSSSRITVGVANTSVFQVNGRVLGDYDLTKEGVGVLDLHTDGASYFGRWIVKEGTLRVSEASSLGKVGVDVESGVLEIAQNTETDQLEVSDGATLQLNATLAVKSAKIGENVLRYGTYTAEELPDYIKGDGKLIVNIPSPILVKEGEGESTQEINVGDEIVPFSYSWEYADETQVSWVPKQPEGISVITQESEQRIRFSGKPTEIGLFKFTVTAQSEAYNEAKKSGELVVRDPSVSCKSPKSIIQNHFSAQFEEGTLRIHYEAKANESAHFYLADITGKVVYECAPTLHEGENIIEESISIPCGTYLLQKRGNKGMRTIKVVIE